MRSFILKHFFQSACAMRSRAKFLFAAICIIAMCVCFSSCMKQAIDFATFDCQSDFSFQSHPKQQLYQSLLDKYRKMGLTGISVLIDKDGEDLWAGTAGVSSIESGQLLKLCHVLPVGSVGKMYCGVATMQLVESGVLQLDKTIDQYLPDDLVERVPNAHIATLANLLSHTSGIPDYEDDPNLFFDFLNNNQLDFSREAVLETYVYDKQPKFSPGTEYSYSNSNYEVLTIVLDHVLGSSHANLYSNYIFKPLDLASTYYKNETNYDDLYENGMANGYFDRHSDGKLENATDLSLTIAKGQTGSDGVVTNVLELHTFLKGIFEAQLIADSTLELMKEYTKATYHFKTYKYGLGLSFRDEEKNFGLATSIGYSGSLPGFSTEAWFFPERNTYIIFIANDGNIINGPVAELVDDFREELYQLVLN